jgi:hypothetical protein
MSDMRLTLFPNDARFAENLTALRQARTRQRACAPTSLVVHTFDDGAFPAVSAHTRPRDRQLAYSDGQHEQQVPLGTVKCIEVWW